MTTYENVLLNRAGGVGTVTLNRPDKLNAFAGRMRQEVADAVQEMAADGSVRIIVITGAGRAFCAGADIGYMRQLLETKDWTSAEALVEAGRAVVTTIRETPKPVIACVNGAAAGGGANLALSCDLRIASDQATIGQTFNRIGLHPDWGGTYFLPRLVGPAKALELFFSADMIGAPEAQRLGLFNRVVPHADLARETAALAGSLAAKAPLALALAKKAVYASAHHTLDEMLSVELAHQLECFQSQDAAEGLQAFLDRRPATFIGK